LIIHHGDESGRDFFETITADEVLSVIANPQAKADYTVSLGTRVAGYPASGNYLFKTRGGTVGVFQIAGFTNDLNGVKLRCKRVQKKN